MMSLFRGRGVRKRSRSDVLIELSSDHGGKCVVNNLPFNEYFPNSNLSKIEEIFGAVQVPFDGYVVKGAIRGGGKAGQLSALCFGIADALLEMSKSLNTFSEFKSSLRRIGYVSVDSRRVESKKPGQPKARRKRQFSKR